MSLAWIDEELESLDRGRLLRETPAPLARQGAVVEHLGRRLVNFASNDYLALAGDARLEAAAVAACRAEGVGRGAAPLVCGRSAAQATLERRLAEFEGVEAALTFPSGFAANMGTIPALVDRGDAVYADAKNHASLIDGCRLARAERLVYPHNDAAALARLLREGGAYRRRLIVTDGLFSMDGDLAPLADLAELARRHDAMLLVDEAHATGVFGAGGRGAAEHLGAADGVDVRVGTLSKALGSAGGFVAGSAALVRWLANRARSYVFSTAQPAAGAAAAVAALDAVAAAPRRGGELLEAAAALREALARRGWDTGTSASQIIPLRVGEAGAALAMAARLRELGYWVPPIRPPAVPPGESLLRVTLTAGHTPQQQAGLIEALEQVRRRAD